MRGSKWAQIIADAVSRRNELKKEIKAVIAMSNHILPNWVVIGRHVDNND
jgi:hypothetical protein